MALVTLLRVPTGLLAPPSNFPSPQGCKGSGPRGLGLLARGFCSGDMLGLMVRSFEGDSAFLWDRVSPRHMPRSVPLCGLGNNSLLTLLN